jgi:hypothetical protein
MLVREPLFKTGATEGMQAIDKSERLIENFGTNEAYKLLLKVKEASTGSCIGGSHVIGEGVVHLSWCCARGKGRRRWRVCAPLYSVCGFDECHQSEYR